MPDERPRMNEDIRAPHVRPIDHLGHDRGIVPIEEALRVAMRMGLALVQTLSRDPSVCRLLEYERLD